jgi:hypothetical protein
LWKEAWATLGWKYRLQEHYEVNWKLLHKRPQRVMNMHDSIGLCKNCGQKGEHHHVYLSCPEVQGIWNRAEPMLERLLGHPISINISISGIVLMFPTLRQSLQRDSRMRVVLWHSAIIYTITKFRERDIRNQERHGVSGIQIQI